MSGEELVVAIIAITMAGGVLIVGISKISDLIKTWMNRNNSSIPEEEFDRLAKAFMQHKKNTEHRLKNLEAIASEEDTSSSSSSQSSSKQIEAPKKEIEFDDRETEQEPSQSGDSNNLRNMLHE